MKTTTKVIAAILVLTIAGVGAFQLTKEEETKGVEIEAAKVELATIIQKVNATGKIQPKTKVNISADVSAKITKLEVKEGDWVEKGQFLVELDRERYIASLESAEANVRSAQGQAKLIMENLKQAKRVLDRAKELVSKKLDSQAALDSAEAAYQVEVARHESALDQIEQTRGMLKQSQDALSKTTIYSPMSGTISKLNKEFGEIAIGSQFQEDVIMIIANLNDMEALVKVDENDIVSIALGQQAEIEVDALSGRMIKGQVTEIASSAVDQQGGNNNQKTEFEVTISITSDVKELRPGMTASADIVTDTRHDAVSVPLQSVTVRTVDQLKMEGRTYTAAEDGFVEVVFVVANNKATAKQVKTGIQDEANIEIVEGVKVGENIVIGSYRAISRELENGSDVTIKEEEEK